MLPDAAHTASSSRNILDDGLWHHVVGVCDEANGHIYLYLDGSLIGSATIPAGSGILASTIPLRHRRTLEGANNNPVSYDYQFIGQINDVAIYNQALSAAQVQNHYYSAAVVMDVPPIANPDSYTVNENTTNAFAVTTNDVVQTQGGYLTVIGVSPTNGGWRALQTGRTWCSRQRTTSPAPPRLVIRSLTIWAGRAPAW